MSGDPFSTDHMNWLPGSVGPPSGFGEGFSAGYDLQYHVNSMYGLEDEVYDKWQKSLFKLETVTGQRFEMPLQHRDINNYISAVEGKDPSTFYQDITLEGFDPGTLVKQREAFTKANEVIKTLNNPDILSMEDIVKQVKESRAGFTQQAAIVDETGGFTAGLGQFVGGVAGSFSTHDPANVVTLPIGGWGKTAAARIATEMGVMGGIASVQEYGAVEPNRELLGEEPGNPTQGVIMAMIGAGIFRGGVEGIGKLVGKFNEGQFVKASDFEKSANESWINSAKLRETFEQQPQSPSARAGIHILNVDELVRTHNPYGDTEFGYRQFMADVEDVQRVVNGNPETAVGRFLPDQPAINFEKLNVNEEIVKASRPEIFNQLEAAQLRMAEVDERIASQQDMIGDLTVADAIARVDPESGNLAKSLEDDLLNSQLTAKQRETITQKLDQIIESLGGAEKIASEAKNAAIQPKKVLQGLRGSRKAAAKNLRAARREFDRALEQVEAEAKVKAMLSKPVVDGRQPTGSPHFDPSTNRPDTVASRSTEVTAAEEALPDTSENIARNMETDEGIDIGNGQIVDPEFRFSDPDNPGAEITASQLAKELKDDEALLEAMKVCSL